MVFRYSHVKLPSKILKPSISSLSFIRCAMRFSYYCIWMVCWTLNNKQKREKNREQSLDTIDSHIVNLTNDVNEKVFVITTEPNKNKNTLIKLKIFGRCFCLMCCDAFNFRPTNFLSLFPSFYGRQASTCWHFRHYDDVNDDDLSNPS